MTQEEAWLQKYNEVTDFVKRNQRNPSKYYPEERGRYCNWIKHNKKLYNAGEMRTDRMEMFKELMKLCKEYQHVNQFV